MFHKKKMFTPEWGTLPAWVSSREAQVGISEDLGLSKVNAGHDTIEKGVRQKQYSDVDALAMRLNIDINMIHISIFTVFCGSCWCKVVLGFTWLHGARDGVFLFGQSPPEVPSRSAERIHVLIFLPHSSRQWYQVRVFRQTIAFHRIQ